MASPNDEFDPVKAKLVSYSIPEAAALWCGVAEHDLPDALVLTFQDLTEHSLGVWNHPMISGIAPRTRAISQAIYTKQLSSSYKNLPGTLIPKASMHALDYKDCRVLARHLKDWMKKAFPTEKPAFLFEESEQISLVEQIDQLTVHNAKLTAELKALAAQVESSKAGKKKLDKRNTDDLSPRSENAYLRIVGALLEVVDGKLLNIDPHPAINSSAELIRLMVASYSGRTGISKSNLEAKFCLARKTIDE